MTDIWFYHLQRRSLESALPGLIEKCLDRGWRVAVQAASDERLEALDLLLWTYSDASFLAHGVARDGDPELQPVYLCVGEENPNGAQARFFVEGAPVAPALAAQDSVYARALVVFNGADEAELGLARAQWRELKDAGFALTYWREDDAGRWEKGA